MTCAAPQWPGATGNRPCTSVVRALQGIGTPSHGGHAMAKHCAFAVSSRHINLKVSHAPARPVFAPPSAGPGPDGRTHPGLSVIAAAVTMPPAKTIELNIAHINDTTRNSMRLPATELMLDGVATVELGGFARQTAVFKALAGTPNLLKLHAGDAITGLLYYTFFKGKADAQMMNSICFDAFVPGNHEFDDGDGVQGLPGCPGRPGQRWQLQDAHRVGQHRAAGLRRRWPWSAPPPTCSPTPSRRSTA